VPAEATARQSDADHAWLELVGRPSHHVSNSHDAGEHTRRDCQRGDIRDIHQAAPTVFATASPERAPARLKHAASNTAWREVKTLVETTVAMALAAS